MRQNVALCGSGLTLFLDEKETSEKESCKYASYLNNEKWSLVFGHLQPYLRPYGDSSEGRLDFYHRALSKAVRQRYCCIVFVYS